MPDPADKVVFEAVLVKGCTILPCPGRFVFKDSRRIGTGGLSASVGVDLNITLVAQGYTATVRQGKYFPPLNLLAARTTLNINSRIGTSCPPEKLKARAQIQQLLLSCLLLLSKPITEETQTNGNEPSGLAFFLPT